jgi:5'(3')-deoxyribonucleotidase
VRLGIDLDGVVANFTKGWVDFYNRDFEADLTPEQVVTWDGVTDITHFESMSQFWRWTSDLDGRSLFWHLETFPDAVDALQTLDRDGHDIVILTMKPRFAIEDTHEWIAAQEIPYKEVHILEEKWKVDCDVYLDDGPHILEDLVAHRPDRLVCRYVRPWNQPLTGAVDVADFREFRDLVTRAVESEPAPLLGSTRRSGAIAFLGKEWRKS